MPLLNLQLLQRHLIGVPSFFFPCSILTYFRLKVNNLKQIILSFIHKINARYFMYKRIRDLREDKDLNQTQVAKILGMSQTGYSKYETGENDVPTDVLIKLSEFYNVSVDYILELTDNPKINK